MGGGIYVDSCQLLSITESIINENQAKDSGAGILIKNKFSEEILLNLCEFSYNSAGFNGGGIAGL